MSPILRTLLDEFVVPAVSNVSLKIRDAAVKAIGCLSLRDAKAAKKHLLLVIQVSFLGGQMLSRSSLKGHGPIRVNVYYYKYVNAIE